MQCQEQKSEGTEHVKITAIEQRILEILRSVQSPAPNICATELFCEGWLLRLILSAWSKGIDSLPFPPNPDHAGSPVHSSILLFYRTNSVTFSLKRILKPMALSGNSDLVPRKAASHSHAPQASLSYSKQRCPAG
jgi:hypothetical protein